MELCREEIQPLEKWVGVRSKLLPTKKDNKNYASTRKESNYKVQFLPGEEVDFKGLCFYPEKKQPIVDRVEILEKMPLNSGVGRLVVESLYTVCRLSIAVSFLLSLSLTYL